jgi:thiol-disulfide isomerase/thioredoxin
MSEQTIFNISTEIHGQHLLVRLNDRSIFCLNKPTAERYQLTLEQDAGKYVIWMRQGYSAYARLYTTEDVELASLIMSTTADALSRMAMNFNATQTIPAGKASKWKWFAPGVLCIALAATWLAPKFSGPVPVPVTQFASVPVISQIKPAPPAVTATAPTLPASQTQGTQVQGAPSLSPEAAAEARALLAERLKNGAAKQVFTIRLSSGHERSLYIFLDPECPNCRIFEPTVQALAEDYNVEIFPVTLVGKTRTADEVAPLLCAAPEKRAEMWKSLYDTGAGMLNLTDKAKADVVPAACDAGKLALARNDLAFELYRMPGTPTVISDDGRMIPLQAMASDAALKSFLNTRQ